MGTYSETKLVCPHLRMSIKITNKPQGNESVAVVEFAPNQKVASEKKKVDNRMGTIDQGT